MAKRNFANTSSGAAHVYVHPQALHTNSCKNAPLPPLLQRRVPGLPRYSITSHTEHDPKPVESVLRNVIYSKPAPHWRTHFLNGLAQKLRDSESVRLASVPSVSEMRDQYSGRSALYEPLDPHYRVLQTLHGQIHQSSVLLPREPELSTAHADYRRFSRSELAHLSPSNASPIHGHFTKSAPLPRLQAHKAPPSASSQLQLPCPPVPIPHGGRSSVYMDSFHVPAPLPMSSDTSMTVLAGTEENGRSLLQHILGVPEMYNTENQTYGKGRMVLV
ncbi:hypothetical protein KOW79_001306 [Hemibagrus wyckioides]|uniref:Uncharacterized protein n=1 Tax=Hemibagrus wyckioides TaxID=337641 RepID=A0A9D3P7Y1_9TELE|nr:uncharacterized protein zgc:193811 [Hemibagrus wyckioides]XP_058274674.1 uncharacterized protein zgc:193811 [Hemibagrus wyckioides]KAG7334710.1 hypothetical protein KOW79_001306 [Hemibagrus wyckioides]